MIHIDIEVTGYDAEDAADAVEAALDNGGIQEAIEDARDARDLKFEIESAVITGTTIVDRIE